MVVEESLIKEIVKFGNGPLKNQLKAVEILYKNGDEICADKNVLLKLLQTFVKFLVSKNPIVQKEGAYFIMSISEKDFECTKAIIDSNNALSKLINLLSSSNPQVLEQALMCLGNIAADFPEEIVQANVLQPLTHCLNSNLNESIIKEAAILLRNISDIQQNIHQIVASGSIEPLINLLDSEIDRKIVEKILLTLFNIISCNVENCNIILDHSNISKAMNQLLNRVGAIKLLASQFIEKAISYGKTQTDKIVDESIIPILIKQINSGTNNDEIKINLVKIIKIIIKFKPEFIDSMININIVSILSNILGINCDDNLIIAVLSTLNDIIHAYGYEKIEQKLQRCGTKMKVQKLLDHGNEEIRELSSIIFDFVGDYNIPRGRKIVKRKISESNAQLPPTSNQILLHSVRSALMNKRNKISMDQTDTEQSASPIENEMYGNDFDNQLSRNSTPIYFDDESTLNNVSRKPSPVPPIVLVYRGDTTISINNALQNENVFETIKYYRPSENFVETCCKSFGINFDSDSYIDFVRNIKIKSISSNSIPDTNLQTENSFGCFSLFLTGSQENTKIIEEKLKDKSIEDMDENCLFDKENKEKVKKIMVSQLTDEHFETIVKWFKCRIIIFYNGIWQRFGNWNSESEHYVPIFVLEKKNSGDKFVYEIVLTLKNDYQNLHEDVEEIHPIENEVRIDEHADINIPTMNTENSTDESPEDIALLSDDIAAEGNPSDNNQPEDVEEIHPIENSTDENATADPSHSTSRQANIIHENEITVTMQASPGSTSNQSKIIRAPNYRIGPEYYGNRWVKHLYIFDSDDKSMCYNYTLKKGNYFYCTKCKTSNKIIISATIISNENGEECVKLGENGHVCQKQKYQPHIIIYEPNYKLNTEKVGKKYLKHLHVFDSNDKTLFYDYTSMFGTKAYRCSSCVYNHNIHVTATLTIDENGKECCVLNAQKHRCTPQKL